ncbi:MAG: GNAT family N-acetyltransferase [Acidaminococcaceae bacterium]
MHYLLIFLSLQVDSNWYEGGSHVYHWLLAKRERICVLPQFRKLRAGVMLLEGLENLARAKGMTKAKLHGQKQAENFYHKQGYRTSSEIFMEDGIPHLLMLKTL